MLETRAFRRLTSLLALTAFLAAAGGEVFGYDPCPHHLGIAGGDAAGELAEPGDAAAHVPPHGGGTPHAASRGDSPSSSHGDHSGPCTCIGTCHASATAPVVAQAPLQTAIAPRPRAERRPATTIESPHRQIVGELLPYPNGPPTS